MTTGETTRIRRSPSGGPAVSGQHAGRRRGVGRRTNFFKSSSSSGVEVLTNAHERLSGLLGHLLGRLGHSKNHAERVPEEDRRRIVEHLFHEGARFKFFAWRFAALMWMSVTIAVLGLLADSTAVVIGAMLVAPLMLPILGFAAALVMGWPMKAMRQAGVAAVGAIGAIALAALVSAVIPGNPDPIPSEILARTKPNLLDLGVAMASGAAGAYSQVRRQASDAITGVAVAVALVPPLAVVGVTLQLGEMQLASGAFMLFLTNVAGIAMAASVTFIACGFVPPDRLLAGNAAIATGLRWVGVSVLIVMLPLSIGKGHLTPPDDPYLDLKATIEQFFVDTSDDKDLVDLKVGTSNGSPAIDMVIAGSGTLPAPEELANRLAGVMGERVEVNVRLVETEDSTVVGTDSG